MANENPVKFDNFFVNITNLLVEILPKVMFRPFFVVKLLKKWEILVKQMTNECKTLVFASIDTEKL